MTPVCTAGGLLIDFDFGGSGEPVLTKLEDHIVTINRASGTLPFPVNFQLIAAMNPCPCGYWGDHMHNCTWSPAIVTRYQKRISGPLLDRFGIHMDLPRVDYEKLTSDYQGMVMPSCYPYCFPP